MTVATATEVKNHFGEYVDKAQQEPVSIEKNGRKHAVLLSQSEYERLQAIENAHWAQKAAERLRRLRGVDGGYRSAAGGGVANAMRKLDMSKDAFKRREREKRL